MTRMSSARARYEKHVRLLFDDVRADGSSAVADEESSAVVAVPSSSASAAAVIVLSSRVDNNNDDDEDDDAGPVERFERAQARLLCAAPYVAPPLPVVPGPGGEPAHSVFGTVSSPADAFSLSPALIHRALAARPRAMGQRASSRVLQKGGGKVYSGRRPLFVSQEVPLRPNSQRLGVTMNLIGNGRTSSMLDLLRPGCPSSPGS
jgi:hypothetical protein